MLRIVRHLLCVVPTALPLPSSGQTPADPPAVISMASVDMATCQRPRYPAASLAARERGTTVVRLVVQADGAIRDLLVERSSGSSVLDQAALEAFARCKGLPALINGVPITAYTRISNNWRPESPPQVVVPTPVQTDVKECQPIYPAEAIRRELQGNSKVQLTIDEKGDLQKIELAQSSGFSLLDAAAMSGLATCRFKPGVDANGVAVLSAFVVEYQWKLR